MLKLLLGDPNTRKLKRYQPIVEEINFLEEEISQLTDEELRRETHNLKLKISSELGKHRICPPVRRRCRRTCDEYRIKRTPHNTRTSVQERIRRGKTAKASVNGNQV